MNTSSMTGSCSRLESSLPLSVLCPGNATNHSNDCNQLATLIFFLKLNCYIIRLFYSLTVILIIIGTILNSFSSYCFLKMTKRNPQNVYLFVLSLGDTIGLHMNFTLPMLRQFGRFDDFFRNSNILCRITGVLTESFLIFPTWIVVLLTIERFICILYPLKRHSFYTQKRAKISIIILAIIVVLLSLYRLFDIKGIDQISVFSVVACNVDDHPLEFMRNLNLMIWTILPECFTLILSLIIIYEIRLATQRFQPYSSKAHRSRYNQATKTVLLLSILFLVFHTPTGIMIAVDLFYVKTEVLAVTIILVSRKITITLYEINLCCKFFIYYQTFRYFKGTLHKSLSRFVHRTNSAKLGRAVYDQAHDRPINAAIHFGPIKQSLTSPGSQSDSYTKTGDEHHNSLTHRNPRTSSTNLSRFNRGYQPLSVLMVKTEQDTHISLQTTPNLLRRCSVERRRLKWTSKPQMTL